MKLKRLAPFASPALTFVLAIGVVNLFGDVTYEGGASINGPFLASLGASAAAISIIAGLGEFLGYSLRSVSGYLADRTGRYWLITFVGYAINLLAVPAMALTGNWWAAAALILAERIGRAIRKPTVEAMLSYTTGKLGKGWVYGINTALDETGAMLGPLALTLALVRGASYRVGYELLLGSVALALIALVVARIRFPLPSRLEQGRTTSGRKFSTAYWLYMVAGACFAAGVMSFEFVSFHLAKVHIVRDQWIPLLLATGTAASIVASLVLGRLYDRVGLPAVLLAVFLTAAFSPLVFLGHFFAVLVGVALWGVGYAMQDTLLKAIIAGVMPEGRRNFAFGLYYIGYGGGWLVGSVTVGLLYERSLPAMIAFAVAMPLLSMPLFILAERSRRRNAAHRHT